MPHRTGKAQHVDARTLAGMTTRDLTAHAAGVNIIFEEARQAFEAACRALGDTLTEQIARHVLAQFPTAHTLRVLSVAEFHLDADGDLDPDCEGHEERLVPAAVLDANGVMLGNVDDLSPVVYWVERLTPMMGDQADLELPTRTWYVESDHADHADDAGESDGDRAAGVADVDLPPITEEDLARALAQWSGEAAGGSAA